MTKIEQMIAKKAIKEANRRNKPRHDRLANAERKRKEQEIADALAAAIRFDVATRTLTAIENQQVGVVLPDGTHALWSGLPPSEKYTVVCAVNTEAYTVAHNGLIPLLVMS